MRVGRLILLVQEEDTHQLIQLVYKLLQTKLNGNGMPTQLLENFSLILLNHLKSKQKITMSFTMQVGMVSFLTFMKIKDSMNLGE